MGKQIVIEILNNLNWGVGILSFTIVVNPLLKNLHAFYKTRLKYSYKNKKFKSWESTEKKKLKAERKKKKAPR